MFPITKMQQGEPEGLNDSANKCYIVAPIQMLRAIPDYREIIDAEFKEIFGRAGRDASGNFNAEWGDDAVDLINGIRAGSGEVIGRTEQFDPAAVFQAVAAVMPDAVLQEHMGLQLGSKIKCDGCALISERNIKYSALIRLRIIFCLRPISRPSTSCTLPFAASTSFTIGNRLMSITCVSRRPIST